KTTVSQQKELVIVEERGTFQTACSYQICYFGAMFWYQQRGRQTLHLLSYHTAAGPKQSRQLTTWLNTMGKYELQWLGEFEVSDAVLFLCAVH
ncbi:TVA12 protein, partial [Herpetotheres cachinnans]|nr:TVA12 protein [Herpetotheres cachinnans]